MMRRIREGETEADEINLFYHLSSRSSEDDEMDGVDDDDEDFEPLLISAGSKATSKHGSPELPRDHDPQTTCLLSAWVHQKIVSKHEVLF